MGSALRKRLGPVLRVGREHWAQGKSLGWVMKSGDSCSHAVILTMKSRELLNSLPCTVKKLSVFSRYCNACLQSQHSGGRGRRITNSRPARSTQ
jgi:hypothetical protein